MRDDLLELAAAASQVALRHFRSNGLKIDTKADRTVVTNADFEISDLLISSLPQIKNIAVLSEEKGSDEDKLAVINQHNEYWLVDPLDGTRSFAEGKEDFCILISLIRAGKPVLGCVANPCENVVYFTDAPGVFSCYRDKKIAPVVLPSRHFGERHRVLLSRSHRGSEEKALQDTLQDFQVDRLGSGLKFLEIAKSKYDLYFRLTPTSLWDSAAGQVFVENMGGVVADVRGDELIYKNKTSLLNPPFVAVAESSRLSTYKTLLE